MINMHSLVHSSSRHPASTVHVTIVHIFMFIQSVIHSFIQALKQVGSTVYSEIKSRETVNKFRVITGRKSPLTRYDRAIQILQCYVANNSLTHTTQITNIKTNGDVPSIHIIRISIA